MSSWCLSWISTDVRQLQQFFEVGLQALGVLGHVEAHHEVAERIDDVEELASGRQFLYIVDPLGNLMMRFDVAQNPKGLKSDLEKLLKLSHIG